jgi:hypothetical protein
MISEAASNTDSYALRILGVRQVHRPHTKLVSGNRDEATQALIAHSLKRYGF